MRSQYQNNCRFSGHLQLSLKASTQSWCESAIPLYICHSFFFHSSVDGHLGHFYVLVIVNNTAMNIGVHVSFWIGVFVFLNIYPGVELLGHMVALFLVFWGTSILFSTVAAPIYIPTNSAQRFPFLHILRLRHESFHFISWDTCFRPLNHHGISLTILRLPCREEALVTWGGHRYSSQRQQAVSINPQTCKWGSSDYRHISFCCGSQILHFLWIVILWQPCVVRWWLILFSNKAFSN